MGDTHHPGLILDARIPIIVIASHLTVYLEPAMAQQEGRNPSFA